MAIKPGVTEFENQLLLYGIVICKRRNSILNLGMSAEFIAFHLANGRQPNVEARKQGDDGNGN
jgi:hypothetical protein